VTIGVITAGANSSTRRTLRVLIMLLTPRASSRPMPFWMTVMATAISSVCHTACNASPSSSMSVKLRRPMNTKSGSRPSQSVKA
jgi:hypothetical protein